MNATREQVAALAKEAANAAKIYIHEEGDAEWNRRAIEAECRVPEGYVLVPVEPSDSQLDVAVSFALNVRICSDYNWSAYMRDVYARMIAAAPKPDPERKHEIVPTIAAPVAQEPVSAHDAVVVDRKRVWIKVGNQSFMLSYEPEDEPEMSAWQQAEWYAGQLRKALSRITHGVKTETAVSQDPVAWECFEDTSYFNMWAVRPVGEKQWGKCFHVINGAEAEALCAVLNTQPDQSAEELQKVLDYRLIAHYNNNINSTNEGETK